MPIDFEMLRSLALRVLDLRHSARIYQKRATRRDSMSMCIVLERYECGVYLVLGSVSVSFQEKKDLRIEGSENLLLGSIGKVQG